MQGTADTVTGEAGVPHISAQICEWMVTSDPGCGFCTGGEWS